MSEYVFIDGHNDLPWQLHLQFDNQLDAVDLRQNISSLHTDIPKLRAGGLTGQFWSVYVVCNTDYTNWADHVRLTMDQIDVTKRMIQQYSDVRTIVFSYWNYYGLNYIIRMRA